MNLNPELKSATSNYWKIIGLVVLTAIIISGILWYSLSLVPFTAETSLDQENSLSAGKYAGALKRLAKVQSSFNAEMFQHPTFVILKQFIKLPLELGRLGKENPFNAPPAPEKLLLSPQ